MTAVLLELATRAAARAADYLVDGWAQREVVGTKSSGTDVVTQMDRGSEQILVDTILRSRPDDAILGEEGGSRPGSSGVTWVIDPLDGTVNYLYGLPSWAVSVGAVVDGRPVVGVVHAPALGKVWRGADGSGGTDPLAEVGGTAVRASQCDSLDMALVATGFGYDPGVRAEQGRVVAGLLPRVRDIRRAGAAAVDMCWVAQGLVDAYYERGTHPWDRAAGTVIARAAGAVVCGLHADEADDAMTIAAAPGVVAALRTALVEEGA
jgi:myo-inositol-1(or 4)-monophosphatase